MFCLVEEVQGSVYTSVCTDVFYLIHFSGVSQHLQVQSDEWKTESKTQLGSETAGKKLLMLYPCWQNL